MRAQVGLTAAQLLELIDAGTGEDAAWRGRLLLGAAADELPGRQLDQLSLGGRDAWILALRCNTFGDVLAARVNCPECGLLLSVKVPRDEVTRQPPAVEGVESTVRVEHGSLVVEARSPHGAVLAAAARCADVDSARLALIHGCVVDARRDGEPVDPGALDEQTLERIGEAIVGSDPQAEVDVSMTCAACGHDLTAVLDITEFFWRELTTTSVQLLDEVHQLAIGYGWSEEQVLRLPSRRRREYVERVTSE
jgi:hypothetical protein